MYTTNERYGELCLGPMQTITKRSPVHAVIAPKRATQVLVLAPNLFGFHNIRVALANSFSARSCLVANISCHECCQSYTYMTELNLCKCSQILIIASHIYVILNQSMHANRCTFTSPRHLSSLKNNICTYDTILSNGHALTGSQRNLRDSVMAVGHEYKCKSGIGTI